MIFDEHETTGSQIGLNQIKTKELFHIIYHTQYDLLNI